MGKALFRKQNGNRNGKNRLLILLAVFSFCSCTNERPEIRILFVGDILLSRNVKDEYDSRKTFPWGNLKQRFNSVDLVIGNLEGAVGNPKDQINPLIPAPVFAIDSADISLLRTAGFNAITVENNHIFDLGFNGKIKTISTLIENQIKPISFENSPNFIKIDDHVISVISINAVINRDSTKHSIPSIELKQKLRLAQNLSNIVIVSIHWGSELLDWPNKEQRNAAEWLVENGADIIIGHHPHVIQNPELVKGKPVFFSLGNHLFDQKYPKTKVGLIADIRLKNGKIYCSALKTRTQPNSFYPEVFDSLNLEIDSIKYKKDFFMINNLKLIPHTIDSENKIIIQAFQNDKFMWNSHPMSLVTIENTKIDGKNEHLFTLEKYYSSLDKEVNIRPYVYGVTEKGIIARWRGSALAWPLLDARVSQRNQEVLCALHRGDNFITLNKGNYKSWITAYQWNGFGFKALDDTISTRNCTDLFE